MDQYITKGFEILLDKIRKDLGFCGDQYKAKCLRRRLNSRMRRHNMEDDYWAYVKFLEQNPDEYALLLKNLTVNVTKFFRNWPVFSYLNDIVLPELIANKIRRSPLRLWSAGCASGEETYSLAILAMEQKKN